MMNYEIFKEVVAEKFMDYMPEQYQGMRLRVEPFNKVNKVLDGITYENILVFLGDYVTF